MESEGPNGSGQTGGAGPTERVGPGTKPTQGAGRVRPRWLVLFAVLLVALVALASWQLRPYTFRGTLYDPPSSPATSP